MREKEQGGEGKGCRFLKSLRDLRVLGTSVFV